MATLKHLAWISDRSKPVDRRRNATSDVDDETWTDRLAAISHRQPDPVRRWDATPATFSVIRQLTARSGDCGGELPELR